MQEENKDLELLKEEQLPQKEVIQEEKQKPFWRRNFLKLFLLVLLVISLFWGFINNQMTIRKYKKEISELTMQHEEMVKSLKIQEAKKVISTLALAVRSEMIVDNKNQVNQYFLQSLKNANAERLLIVNQNSGVVVLSTNKKDEGQTFKIKELTPIKDTEVLEKDGKLFAATPIMGLNTQLGVLVMEIVE